MIDKDSTLVLFGRSPFISQILDVIPTICQKFHTMGCNYFCETFPQVEYVIFHDDISPRVPEHATIITQPKYRDDPSRKAHGICNTHKKIEFWLMINRKSGFSADPRALSFYFHTPSSAIDWATKRRFETVVLAGIDMNLGTAHFDRATAPDPAISTWNDNDLKIARRVFETWCNCGRIKVLQLNPESDLKIEKISMKELLSDV